jgi:glutathione S-transferase
MKPALVSFRLCPFVRRSVIVMRLKELDHDVVYVDLADPPAWFLEISPLKKVPLLRVGGEVLFESTAINEYLDETGGNSLHPVEPLQKATHRAWIEFSNRAMWHAYHLTLEKTEADFKRALEKMWNDFEELETALSSGPYFSGKKLCLVDVSFAPLFQQLEYLSRLYPGIADNARHPKVNEWWQALCGHPVIEATLGDDFEDLYHALIYRRQGFLSGFVDPIRYADQRSGRY